MSSNRRLSDVVIPGRDYEAKVKIAEVLDHDVLLLSFESAVSTETEPVVDPETGELIYRTYYNVNVDDGGILKTFSTGAIPIAKVLAVLQKKVSNGEVELPLVCCFRKEGRTYVIE